MTRSAALIISAAIAAVAAAAQPASSLASPAAADSASAAAPGATTADSTDANSSLQNPGAGNPLLRGKSLQADSAEASSVFKPSWSLKMEANESYYRLSSGSKLNYVTVGGWVFDSKIDLSKRKYRGRDLEDINESIANNLTRLVPDSYTLNLGLGETYLRQKAFGLSRAGGDMVIENEYVNSALIYMHRLPLTSKSQFSATAGASQGQNDFKYDRRIEGSAGAYMWFDLPSGISLSGGGGVNRKRESSEVGYREFNGMPSEQDTVRARLSWDGRGGNLLDVKYQRRMAVLRKVNPPRGNSLEVIDNPDLAARERSEQVGENLTLNSSIEPIEDVVAVDIDFTRNYNDQQNLIDDRLNKTTTSTVLDAGVLYTYLPGGSMKIDIERSKRDYDYGPISLSSFVEEEKKLNVSVRHDITDSLRVSLSGSAALRQKFFKKRDANPRDADYLYYSLVANMDASPFRNVHTGVKFTYNQYETINIDATLSGDNRTDYTYWVIPNFTVTPARWITIKQEYQIKSEFTDFTYDEEENYLNRTTIMETDAKMNFYRPLRLEMRHRYMMKDKGSYLVPEGGGERQYGRTDENLEHRLDINLDYEPVEDLNFFTYTNFRIQEQNLLGEVDGGVGVVSSRSYESGEIRLGVQRSRDLGDRGKVDLNIGWVKRYGPNLTEERKEFWQIDANVEINF